MISAWDIDARRVYTSETCQPLRENPVHGAVGAAAQAPRPGRPRC